MVVALGISQHGKKTIVCIRHGATESATVGELPFGSPDRWRRVSHACAFAQRTHVSAPFTDFNSLVQLIIFITRQCFGAILNSNIRSHAVPFKALPIRCKPPEDGNSQPVPATHFKLAAPRTLPWVFWPTTFASPFSTAKLASISAALFVH
jgi:hypothetical protein